MRVGSVSAPSSLRRRAVRFAGVVATLMLPCALPAAASAAWQPAGIGATTATLADVRALVSRDGEDVPGRLVRRREHWTYVNGSHRLPVALAVRDGEFRAAVTLGDAVYTAGRTGGARWRGDADGIAHGVQADLQGDAIDRLPDALLPFAWSDCTLAGEIAGPPRTYVVAESPSGDRDHWFFIDATTGDIVRSMTREGRRIVTIAYDRFDATNGYRRPAHWHVGDGDAGNDIDVTVDDVAAADVSAAEVALPTERRVFAAEPAQAQVSLPASFQPYGRILVDAVLNGRRGTFVLDSGTASITMTSAFARAVHADVVLEHASVPLMQVGALQLTSASVLTVPFDFGIDGILGYDFFFGHVVHIDYPDARVEVLTPTAATAAFEDPHAAVLPMNVDQGLPLVPAMVGGAPSEDIALDTGSQRMYVMQPFATRNADQIVAHWTRRRTIVRTEEYLEGSIRVIPYSAPDLQFGPVRFRGVDVGIEVPNDRPDAIAIPFDGIIGTDVLQHFDLWFDYDRARIALKYRG